MNPSASSQYSAMDVAVGYPDRAKYSLLSQKEIGFLSIVYVTYIMCIRNRVRGKRVLEIGPGRGAWSKAILAEGARTLQLLDALPAEHNQFFQYVDPDGDHRDRISYKCVDDFECVEVEDNTIDFFFSFGCFCHISRKGTKSYFASLARKMVSGAEGFIMISDYNKVQSAIGESPSPLDLQNNDLKFVEDSTPAPGRWYHLGKYWFADMITREGFTVLDLDIGCNVRDPVVHFRR